MIVSVLTALATSIGMAQALALLDQTRRLRRAGSAQEVSVAFLSASLIGNVVWFAYGTFRLDAALLVVNSAGLLGGTATLVTALRLRRSRPRIPTARSNPLAVVGSRGQQAQPTRAARRRSRPNRRGGRSRHRRRCRRRLTATSSAVVGSASYR